MSEPPPPAPPARLRLGGSLRRRTLALLLAATAACAVAAVAIGEVVLGDIRHDLGSALARDSARQTQQRTLAKVGRELALSHRLAESLALADWLDDEYDPQHRRRLVAEAENFRRAFADHSYFIARRDSLHYYYADPDHAPEPVLGYTISADNPDNAWFFATLASADGHLLNVDFDKAIGVTNVWINVATPGARAVVGTGLDLTRFLHELLQPTEAGVTTMIIDRAGVIVAHPDQSRMEFARAGKHLTEQSKTLLHLLDRPAEQAEARQLLTRALDHPDEVPAARFTLDGRPHMVALAPIPSLRWTVVSAVDLTRSGALTGKRLAAMVALAAALLGLLALAASLGFDRLVLRPLAELTASIRRIAAGEYTVRLHSTRQDELGELTRAFDAMAQRVRAHSEHLERLVSQRTGALAEANQRLRETNRQLTDSIRYASLIQSAILPDRPLAEDVGEDHFVLWRPRDVVGGDFYLYRRAAAGGLFGVVDCAGHGVPGACMTMIAHAALEVALGDTPASDPAALLQRVDAVARSMLPGDDRGGRVATNMDMGLAWVDRAAGTVTFAGARLALLWYEAGACQRFPGSRRGINDRLLGHYDNAVTALGPGRTFYLATDGLLDQAGGDQGFGFGQARFAQWVAGHGQQPLAEQKQALIAALDGYRGDAPQRDDITVLAFRGDNLR